MFTEKNALIIYKNVGKITKEKLIFTEFICIFLLDNEKENIFLNEIKHLINFKKQITL